MPTNYYDVAIVGHDVPVVATGALLARRGFRVLWLGDGEPRDAVTWDDLDLPTEPFFFAGAERPATRRVLHETALTQVLKRRLVPCRPAFQVALPRARLDVGEMDVLAREVDREFADDRAAAQAALAAATEADRRLDALLDLEATFPPQGFWERREVARAGVDPRREPDPLSAFDGAHPFRRFVEVVATLASDLDPDDLVPAAGVRLFTTWRRGTARLPGGLKGLRDLFLEKIEAQSGELQPRAEAGRIALRRGRVVGIVPRGRREALGCGHVIVGSPERALELCEGEETPRTLATAMEAVRVAAHRYVLNLVLPAEAVPEGMGPIVAAADSDARPLAPDNAFLLASSEPDGRGRVVLTACTLCAAGDRPEDARPRLLAAVARVVPFLEETMWLAHSPHDGLPATGRMADGGPTPLMLPMRPVWRAEAPAWGLGGYPYATGWKGVSMVSRGTLPALGFEGEFAAAWGLARILTLAEGKKDFLKKRQALFGT